MTPQDESNALKVKLLVLKVASRCNLNCTYCYVYNVGDNTWKQQPKVMPPHVMRSLIQRVRTHALRHKLPVFVFVFHGGEPLLCGQQFFIDFVTEAKRVLEPEVAPVFTLQTNGTLLTEEWCRLFSELGISIGISLDGPPEINDLTRVDHAGKGSYAAVRRGIEVVKSSPHIQSAPSLLTVINPDTDPVAIYEHFKSIGLSAVDFLLPEATHDRPYPVKAGSETPYADWLIQIFDRWFHEKPVPMKIRVFNGIISQVLGKKSTIDSLGTNRNEVLVVEADGSIEPIGSLKVCGNGFTKLGANVLRSEFDDALNTELASAYNLSGEKLCATCSKCPIQEVCGGGYLPHRHSQKNGFDNPSVYCKDLMKLITHVQNRVLEQLPGTARVKLGLTPLTYDNAKHLLAAVTQQMSLGGARL
ncbi:radical SAM protein [Pyxidicoccus sp. MSG2]|uniref:radical SAM protein n=1 Tax=Pyxidicoccus sp. MSG2 TaxID=2996790 RepID=UPI0022704C34|nr:radical SAM protein [Pyxidicoccus sp. MSG2]MCY1021711.1 radical SAM protein [Pyxidicoccus sp. MSG2]